MGKPSFEKYRKRQGKKTQSPQERMTPEEYREARFKNESQFEAWVIGIMKANGFKVSSMQDSRAQRWDTDKGFPDLCATDGKRTIFAETKMPGKKTTRDQDEWLHFLQKSGNECFIWYPRHEREIIRVLGGSEPL